MTLGAGCDRKRRRTRRFPGSTGRGGAIRRGHAWLGGHGARRAHDDAGGEERSAVGVAVVPRPSGPTGLADSTGPRGPTGRGGRLKIGSGAGSTPAGGTRSQRRQDRDGEPRPRRAPPRRGGRAPAARGRRRAHPREVRHAVAVLAAQVGAGNPGACPHRSPRTPPASRRLPPLPLPGGPASVRLSAHPRPPRPSQPRRARAHATRTAGAPRRRGARPFQATARR